MCSCCRLKMPKDTFFNKKKSKPIRWTLLLLACSMAWFLPEYREEEYKFRDMRVDDLKQTYVKINSIDFLSTSVKEKHNELVVKMPTHCKDDVLFGFQFAKQNRSIQDHLFMLCDAKKIFANAEIVFSDTTYVMCNEQYADIVKKKKRSSKIIVKAIDIENWDVVEYESQSVKEACILQHAIDILNSRWV